MQDLSRIYILQNLSTALLIAFFVLGAIAIFLFINAHGGIQGIKDRIAFIRAQHKPEKQEEDEEQPEAHHIVERAEEDSKLEVLSESPALTADEEGMEETDRLQDEEGSDDTDILDTASAETEATETKAIQEKDADATDLLRKPIQGNKFIITRKMAITHDQD